MRYGYYSDIAIQEKREKAEKERKRLLQRTTNVLSRLSKEVKFSEAHLFGSLILPYRFTENSDVDIGFFGLNMYHDNWQYLGRKTIEKILEALNIELTELFKVQKDVRPIRRASPQVQVRFDELAEKNTEGTLTPSEREEYEQLVETLEKLTIENAERLILA